MSGKEYAVTQEAWNYLSDICKKEKWQLFQLKDIICNKKENDKHQM